MNKSALKTEFKCLKKLGVGGTAEVFQATAENYPRPIALKIPLPHSDYQSFCLLAQREATLIENLNFPGLVRLHQISTGDDPYIVLDYCAGSTLEDFKSNDYQLITNLISAIALNLEYLKLMEIVHGDFKPENIFLPSDLGFSGLFYVRFSDFSLGRKFNEAESDRAGIGTLGYSAPETIGKNQTDFRSDIFALGVIAFQLFSGQHPFCDNFSDPVKVNGAIQENNPKNLNQLCPELSQEIINLIMSMLAKQPENRPGSGWEICLKLEAYGATYPYQIALAPKYLFSSNASFDEIIAKLELNDKQVYNLIYKTNNDKSLLRLLLEYNFIKNNISYNGQKYEFTGTILFPPYLIRAMVNDFTKLRYTEKKEIITLSIDNYVAQQIEESTIESDHPRYFYEIIFHLLSRGLIKRLTNKRLNEIATDDYTEKAILALLSGQAALAEDFAFQAASNYLNEKKFVPALKVLNSVIRYLNVSGKMFETRQLLKLKGTVYKNMGEIEKSEKVYLDIVHLYDSEQHDALLAEIYKELGNTYKFKQNFNKGIEALDKALKIYQELNNELEISHTYNNIGNIYWVANNYKEALSSYFKAMRIQKRLGAGDAVASSITNIGSIYAMTGKFKRALKIFDISLKLKKEIGNLGEIARTLNNLGYLHHIMNNNNKAIESLQESLEYNRRIGNKKEILINMDNLITMMFISGNIKKTVALLKEGLALAEELEDMPNKAVFSVYMGSVLTRLGKIDDALHYYKQAEEHIAQTDDKINKILLNTEKINTYYLSGDTSTANEIIAETSDIAENITEQNYRVGFQLIGYKVTGEQEYFNKALEAINKLDLKREKFIIYKIELAQALDNKHTEAAETAYERLSKEILEVDNDIELSDACLTIAEYYLSKDNIEETVKYLQKASNQISQHNLSFELMKLKALTGEIKFKQNDYEGCFGDYKQALAIAKEIAGNISDVDLRNRFQSKPIIGFLVRKIKEFSQKIAKK